MLTCFSKSIKNTNDFFFVHHTNWVNMTHRSLYQIQICLNHLFRQIWICWKSVNCWFFYGAVWFKYWEKYLLRIFLLMKFFAVNILEFRLWNGLHTIGWSIVQKHYLLPFSFREIMRFVSRILTKSCHTSNKKPSMDAALYSLIPYPDLCILTHTWKCFPFFYYSYRFCSAKLSKRAKKNQNRFQSD